jgi:hypothetical protein
MLVTIEPEFDIYCKENYHLEDDINEVTDDDNNGYFSEDDLPLDEMNEVSDERFEDHLKDGCAIGSPAKSANRSNKKDLKEPTKKDDLPMYDRKPPPEGIVDDGKLPAPPKLPAFPDSRLTETVSPPT